MSPAQDTDNQTRPKRSNDLILYAALGAILAGVLLWGASIWSGRQLRTVLVPPSEVAIGVPISSTVSGEARPRLVPVSHVQDRPLRWLDTSSEFFQSVLRKLTGFRPQQGTDAVLTSGPEPVEFTERSGELRRAEWGLAKKAVDAAEAKRVAEARRAEEATRAAEMERQRRAAAEAKQVAEARTAEEQQRTQVAEQERRRLEEARLKGEAVKKRLVEARRKAALDRMRTAGVSFNKPDEMFLTRRTQISMILDPGRASKERFTEAFARSVEGEVKTVEVKISERMLAKLHGQSFKIEPAVREAEEQDVRDRPVRWTWYVEPLEPGPNKLLFLELFAVLPEAKDRSVERIQTLEYRIQVNVRFWDRVLVQLSSLAPLGVVFTICGTLFAALQLYWRWQERKEKAAKARAGATMTES
jgi:hypothetical protein